MTPSIDIHTHMLNRDWLELLRQHGKPRFELRKSLDAAEGIMMDGAPFMTPMPGHFDYDYRIKRMDEAKVDMAVVSLTCPNVYFGGPDISLKAARIVNDSMAAAQKQYPSRIRWLASLPWEYPDKAVAELKRAREHRFIRNGGEHHHVNVFFGERRNPRAKAFHVPPHLALGHHGLVRGKEVLNRLLQRHHVARPGLVDFGKEAADRGGSSGIKRPGDDEEPLGCRNKRREC